MNHLRKVIVLQGASGAGKSTYAARLVQEAEQKGRTAAIVSADRFFLNGKGEYVFEPSRLSEAHGACFAQFLRVLADRIEVVIVDNTNTTAVEIAPYMLGASAARHKGKPAYVSVAIHRLGCAPAVAARRNVHGVAEATVAGQIARIYGEPLPPWWDLIEVGTDEWERGGHPWCCPCGRCDGTGDPVGTCKVLGILRVTEDAPS